MAKIYVASSWRNTHQPAVVSLLHANGHSVYDFRNPRPGQRGFQWSEIGLDPKNCTAEQYSSAIRNHPVAALGYQNDMRAMEWADTCVLVLPCGRSAHLEAGWFAGRGKNVIIYTKDGEEPELMALMANYIVWTDQQLLNALDGWEPHNV